MMASQLAMQALAFSASIVVAHLLVPREFGLAASGLVFANLALVLTDSGFASTLVQRAQLSEEDIASAFWASAAIGLAVTLVGFGMSWPIADLYGEPRVQPLFAAMSPMFLLTSLGIVQGALLTRELRFRQLELRTIVSTASGVATVIVLAALGAGPWAIVAWGLVNVGVSSALLWYSSDWRPSRRVSLASLHSMLAFSARVLGSRLLSWGRTNSDNLLIGSVLGSAALGSYAFAFNLIVIPVTRVAGPLAQVFYPAFSRLREPEAIGRVWLRSVRMVAAIVVPTMLGLSIVAPDFVAAVFSQQWHRAVPVLQILAPLGLAQALQAQNYGILQALDRTKTLLRYTAISTAGYVAAFASGLHWGIVGVSVASLVAGLVLEPLSLLLCAQALGLSPRAWLRSIAGVMQAGAAMAAGLFLVRRGLLHTSLGPAPRLALLVVVGAALYVPLLLWRAPEVLEEVRRVRGRGEPA
jgi:O-antigen/teichoic acid export membrane protein